MFHPRQYEYHSCEVNNLSQVTNHTENIEALDVIYIDISYK